MARIAPPGLSTGLGFECWRSEKRLVLIPPAASNAASKKGQIIRPFLTKSAAQGQTEAVRQSPAGIPVGTWTSPALATAAVGSEATDLGGSFTIVSTNAPAASTQAKPSPFMVLREGVTAEAALRRSWP